MCFPCRDYSCSNRLFVTLALPKCCTFHEQDFVFYSGFWISEFSRLGEQLDSCRLHLTFESRSMTVKGSGMDNFGPFVIDGFYSYITNRLALTKTYRSDTSLQCINVQPPIRIQLKWSNQERRFTGKWRNQSNPVDGQFYLRYDQQ